MALDVTVMRTSRDKNIATTVVTFGFGPVAETPPAALERRFGDWTLANEGYIRNHQGSEVAGNCLIVIQLFELSEPPYLSRLAGSSSNLSVNAATNMASSTSSSKDKSFAPHPPTARQSRFTRQHLRSQLIIRTGPTGHGRSFPIYYKISYDDRHIYPSHPYELNVRIEERNIQRTVHWLSKTRPRVLTMGAPLDKVDVYVDRV
ncbi:hypothetical protein BGZ94_001168 [Podila epigama]|nr:hypothetical protein BGZ94_001168 [Podila epigama]